MRPLPTPAAPTQLTTEAGACVLHEVLHDERQAGKAWSPDKLIHGGLQREGHHLALCRPKQGGGRGSACPMGFPG